MRLKFLGARTRPFSLISPGRTTEDGEQVRYHINPEDNIYVELPDDEAKRILTAEVLAANQEKREVLWVDAATVDDAPAVEAPPVAAAPPPRRRG